MAEIAVDPQIEQIMEATGLPALEAMRLLRVKQGKHGDIILLDKDGEEIVPSPLLDADTRSDAER